jgi:hypothetical protein
LLIGVRKREQGYERERKEGYVRKGRERRKRLLIRVRRREKGYERERREGYVRKGREGMEGVVYCGVASFSFLFFLYGQKKTKRTVCLVIHVSKAFFFSF